MYYCHLLSNLIIFGDFNFPKISRPNVSSQVTARVVDIFHETNLTQVFAAPISFRVGQETSLIDSIGTIPHTPCVRTNMACIKLTPKLNISKITKLTGIFRLLTKREIC